ncbi:MAG: galactokinase [Chloroflexi bacterium]|nr:galactokinase [Chloroflexota bacterium]
MTLQERFESLYGRPATASVSAQGRVNLIGEHTDYNDGFVLPMALPLATRVAAAPRADDRVRVSSRERDDGAISTYRYGDEQPAGSWVDYVQAVTSVLTAARYRLDRGLDIALESDVPLGSGLASSAALLVALMRAARGVLGLELDDVSLARLAQRAENDFVGARVGIMDQLCASLGDEHHALFVDTQSLAYERVLFPDTLELVVINSGVSHSNAAGDYNTRRSECEWACALLGVSSLRALTLDDLPRIDALPAPLNRRARHVVTENQRVLDMVAALKAGRLDELGPLMAGSHASMRDDYEVSVPEIDLLVALAVAHPEVVGARLTGGGFGGSIVALTRRGAAAAIGFAVVAAYRARTGLNGRLLVPAGG